MHVRAAAATWSLLAATALIALGGSRRAKYVRDGLAVIMVVVLCMGPWWYRNYQIYGRFVPFNTLMASGNLVSTFDADEDRERTYASLDEGHLDPHEELAYNSRVAALASARAKIALRRDPAAYIGRKVRLAAISLLTYHPNPFGRFSGWGAVTEFIHLGILALGARGAWLHRRDHGAWVLSALPVALVVLHAATLSFSRYLFPMMPFVVVLASLALTRPSPRTS